MLKRLSLDVFVRVRKDSIHRRMVSASEKSRDDGVYKTRGV